MNRQLPAADEGAEVRYRPAAVASSGGGPEKLRKSSLAARQGRDNGTPTTSQASPRPTVVGKPSVTTSAPSSTPYRRKQAIRQQPSGIDTAPTDDGFARLSAAHSSFPAACRIRHRSSNMATALGYVKPPTTHEIYATER